MEDLNCFESKFNHCYYSTRLIKKIELLNIRQSAEQQVAIKPIIKAIYYAKKYHGNQKRATGEPYYSHPMEVAYMIADYLFNTDIIVVSILHDTLEDTSLTMDMISKIFSQNIANQVAALTRIKLGRKFTSAEVLEKLYLDNKKDLLIIKLLDRLHNLLTIQVKSVEKIQYTVLETLKSFLIVAAFCELKDIEYMLSKLCFSIQVQLNLIKEEPYYDFSYDNFQLPYLDRKNNILKMHSPLKLEL